MTPLPPSYLPTNINMLFGSQIADSVPPPEFVIPDGFTPMSCLVTGANSGIGAAVAEELVRQVCLRS